MHHAFKLGDAEHNVEISRSASAYRLHLGGQEIAVDLWTGAEGCAWLTLGDRHIEVVVSGRHAASGDFGAIRRLMTERPHQYTVSSSDDRALAALERPARIHVVEDRLRVLAENRHAARLAAIKCEVALLDGRFRAP